MPIEKVERTVTIENLGIAVSAWRWVCKDCGAREAFNDVPMPQGVSETAAQRKGWRILYDQDEDECLCPACAGNR